MSTSQRGKNRARTRIGLCFSIGLTLIILAATQFSSASRATQEPSQSFTIPAKRPRFVPGEVLVRYRSESLAQTRTGRIVVATRQGELVSGEVERFTGSELVKGLRLVRVAPDQTLKAVAALKRQPEVLYAEPNYILRAEAVPNDPRFGTQWALGKIGVQQVWDHPGTGTGSSSVVVAVLDTGIDINHQDLQPNIWTNPGEVAGNNQDDDGNGFIDDVHGFNFLNDNGTVFSGLSVEDHGSHVAGIIGAKGNNGVGIAGINWSVSLMSLKFLNENGAANPADGGTSDAISACTYASTMRQMWEINHTKGANVRVINASFGGAEFSQSFQDAINELNNFGILFVAAAGNNADGTRELNNNLVPHFPSNFDAPNIISVAATNEADNLSSFSHFGQTSVDLGAPGGGASGGGEGAGIISTVPNNAYASFSGTSMAVPHVVGAAALLWAQNPALSVKQVKDLLLLNGDVRFTLIDKTLTGRRLNLAKSFQSLLENDVIPPGGVSNYRVNFQIGRTFNIGWTAAGDDGAGNGPAALYQLSFVEGQFPNEIEIPLRGILPADPGTAQNVSVTIPYRHVTGKIRLREFDNKGNASIPFDLGVTVPLLDGDPYVPSVGSAAPLSTGGNSVGIDGDDKYVGANLPFAFPFFGTNFTEVIISSNGALYFSEPPRRENDDADDPPGFPTSLGGYKMIAGLWEDIDLRTSIRADAGVFRLESPSHIIFRWQGVPFGGSTPINFEIELRSDGRIKTRYGSGNTNLFPTVGIGGGEQDGYVITSHTSKDPEDPLSLTNAPEVTFTPRAPWSATTLSSSQVEMKSWKVDGRTFVYAKLTFPDAGFRVSNWGTATRAGSAFSADATVERFNGGSAQVISSTAQIWDLGVLDPGNYTFAFKNSGTTVKTLNFTVSATPPAPNLIDEAREFVRWQYKDFLRREPDGPGWDHWTGEITQCSDAANRRPGETEAQCVERKRENTSAAFFVSPEFQNTGYFVLRVYRGSLGRMPHFGGSGTAQDEFTRDAVTVGQGIVVNDALAPDVMNANKQAFVNEFVTRMEFRALYDGLSNTQYVDKLFQTTGVTPSAPDRQALINGLNGGGETRASVLFKVVDGTTTITAGHLMFNTTYGKAFYDKLFNAAFVQMEYFGYLLRDPDPDGFAFWLGKLNFFGDWVNAEMVKAFINSPEYRSRFGAP